MIRETDPLPHCSFTNTFPRKWVDEMRREWGEWWRQREKRNIFTSALKRLLRVRTMVPACSGPSGIGRLCADPCSSGLHDSYPMSHTSLDRGGIELCLVTSKIWFRSTYAKLRLRKIFKSYFDEFTHHFENPYWYQNVHNQNIFHLRCIRLTHAITRLRKIEKTRKSVSSTFLKTDFSKNEKFIENYLDCMSLNIFRSQGADSRLRKWFWHDFHIS